MHFSMPAGERQGVLSGGHVDGVAAARSHEDAIAATASRSKWYTGSRTPHAAVDATEHRHGYFLQEGILDALALLLDVLDHGSDGFYYRNNETAEGRRAPVVPGALPERPDDRTVADLTFISREVPC